jgi:hypothetical protein
MLPGRDTFNRILQGAGSGIRPDLSGFCEESIPCCKFHGKRGKFFPDFVNMTL